MYRAMEDMQYDLDFLLNPPSGSSPDVISTEMGAGVEAQNPPLLIKKLSSHALDFTGYLWTTDPISVLPPNVYTPRSQGFPAWERG